jgi:hypothetical protein
MARFLLKTEHEAASMPFAEKSGIRFTLQSCLQPYLARLFVYGNIAARDETVERRMDLVARKIRERG